MREEWNFMFDNKVFMLPWNNIIGWVKLVYVWVFKKKPIDNILFILLK